MRDWMQNSAIKIKKNQMVCFVCSRCKRQLVWAEATVTVQCPSCGRWVKANKIWQGEPPPGKAKNSLPAPEQMDLFG